MLGSIPDFARGAVVAMVMLVPSAISIAVLQFLEKYNVRYSRISTIEISRHRLRDIACGGVSAAIILCVLSVFARMINALRPSAGNQGPECGACHGGACSPQAGCE